MVSKKTLIKFVNFFDKPASTSKGAALFHINTQAPIIVALCNKITYKNKDYETKLKDDLTIDLLAQFSEALRKKYKITINDDVIDQLN